MENHGTNYKKRWKILRERILAMKEIWTKEEAGISRRVRHFDPICGSHPKPVQKPHPPILMGGYGRPLLIASLNIATAGFQSD
ncbi:MAG: LLM class flavin-dependent oxidoreductase [Acidobacteria bacterium]|nr:LLM class flavin-dependent oxidoreductase [Acidobacteriota bacterium]